MAAEIVNLRQARKRKARAETERTAAENRERFGRPAAARRLDAATKDLEIRKLAGLQRKVLEAADQTETPDASASRPPDASNTPDTANKRDTSDS